MAAKIIIARVARGSWTRTEVSDFIVGAYCSSSPLAGKIVVATVDQEPTSCARNMVVKQCRAHGWNKDDVIMMVDDDMIPNPGFFDEALRVLYHNPGPTVVASPYCGAASGFPVLVQEKDHNGILRGISRQAAARKTGTQETFLVGTGLIATTLATFDAISPPYFDYTYDSQEMNQAVQTEDYYFCCKVLLAKGKVFCTWDHWSDHAKTIVITKPVIDPDWQGAGFEELPPNAFVCSADDYTMKAPDVVPTPLSTRSPYSHS